MAFAEGHGVPIKTTWREYVLMNGGTVDDIKKVFAELDTDKNGVLDYNEVTELAKRFYDGRTPEKSAVELLFKELDTDKSGQITLNDLISMTQSFARCFQCELEPHVLDDHADFHLPNKAFSKEIK